jgi:hypothetical protein
VSARDLKIGDHSYQIAQFSARDGSWIVNQLLTRGLFYALEPQEKELDEKELAGMFAITLRSFSEAESEALRLKCMGACRRYNDLGVPMPLLMANDPNKWAVAPPPDLVEQTVLQLAVLSTNLHCFFAKGALGKLLLVLGGSQQAPGSTATSSAPSQPASGGTAT